MLGKNVPYAARPMCSAPHQLVFQENSVSAGSIG